MFLRKRKAFQPAQSQDPLLGKRTNTDSIPLISTEQQQVISQHANEKAYMPQKTIAAATPKNNDGPVDGKIE